MVNNSKMTSWSTWEMIHELEKRLSEIAEWDIHRSEWSLKKQKRFYRLIASGETKARATHLVRNDK